MACVREQVEAFVADAELWERHYPSVWSPLRRARIRAWLEEWKDRLEGIDPQGDGEGRVDKALLRYGLERAWGDLERQEAQAKAMEPWLPFAPTLWELEDELRRRERPHPRASAQRLQEGLLAIREQRARLAQSPPDTATAYLAAVGAEDALGAWNRVYRFFDGYDPEVSWWWRQPGTALRDELEAYAQELRRRAEAGGHIAGSPIGEEAVRQELRAVGIPYSVEEILTLARREWRWCRQEMVRASYELGYGKNWRGALEKVKEAHVPPGEQPQLIRQLADEAIGFLEDHSLVTIPPLAKETWRMAMMAPEDQKVNPFFLGGEVIRISYPTDTMDHPTKLMAMRGNNRYFSRATVFHELIPGHYLQQFMMERHHPYRKYFRNPYWLEGNALYWEFVFWDQGFGRTPEERMGMLFWRSHRCARVLYTIAFHTGRATTEDCVGFLVESFGHEEENARGEVRRMFVPRYGPLYQCAYLLGAWQFSALRSEFVENGTWTLRQLHDAILQEGPMPLWLLRHALQGSDPASADRVGGGWRFAGDVTPEEDVADAPLQPLPEED